MKANLNITSIVLLTACGNNNDNKNNQSVNKQETKADSNNVKTIATKTLQGDNYRTILPFKESKARGVYKITWHSYNGDDFESGLLTLSKDVFPTDDYLYQDGQYLDKDTLNSYLNPKYTKKEIDKMSEKENPIKRVRI